MPLDTDFGHIYEKNPVPLGINDLSRSRPLYKGPEKRLLPIYSNDMSSLIYCGGSDLSICFLSKNESAFAHFKESSRTDQSDFLNMKESFSQIELEKHRPDE
jgi:hypothetical protein